jgi:sulfate transport system substrate-binding protein
MRGKVFLAARKTAAILSAQVHPFSAPPRAPFTCLSPLFTIAGAFQDWTRAQTTFFADKGVFDQIYQPTAK